MKKPKKAPSESGAVSSGGGGGGSGGGGKSADDEKRPRTAFSGAQLARLKVIFLLFQVHEK